MDRTADEIYTLGDTMARGGETRQLARCAATLFAPSAGPGCRHGSLFTWPGRPAAQRRPGDQAGVVGTTPTKIEPGG